MIPDAAVVKLGNEQIMVSGYFYNSGNGWECDNPQFLYKCVELTKLFDALCSLRPSLVTFNDAEWIYNKACEQISESFRDAQIDRAIDRDKGKE